MVIIKLKRVLLGFFERNHRHENFNEVIGLGTYI